MNGGTGACGWGCGYGCGCEVNRRTGACGCEVRGESGGQERVGVK